MPVKKQNVEKRLIFMGNLSLPYYVKPTTLHECYKGHISTRPAKISPWYWPKAINYSDTCARRAVCSHCFPVSGKRKSESEINATPVVAWRIVIHWSLGSLHIIRGVWAYIGFCFLSKVIYVDKNTGLRRKYRSNVSQGGRKTAWVRLS